jgi:hypothetical protein
MDRILLAPSKPGRPSFAKGARIEQGRTLCEIDKIFWETKQAA